MNCPRCETNELSEHDRNGVTIDRCDACRGIWLDRGELEKLTARSQPQHGGRGRNRDDRNTDDNEADDDDRRGGFWRLFD